MRIISMFCPVFFALLGSALAGPIDFEADLKDNADPSRHQKDLAPLDEGLKNTAAVEAEIELLKAAYLKTVIESPAPLNGSTFDNEDANELNEKAGEEKDLFEGDIILTNDQLALIETSHKSNRSRRQALKDEEVSWGTINPVIPYSYAANYPKEGRAPIISAAMEFWEKNTCVRFKEVTSGHRVEIRDAHYCSSDIGKVMWKTGKQGLNLGEQCMDLTTICHELLHTFGFYHTHTRFDRDKYVRIDFNNTKTLHKGQFRLNKEDYTTLHDIPYEFGSNMHYYHKNGAINSSMPVIYAKPGYEIYQEAMEGRLPTFYDILAVNRHFNCAAKCKSSVDCAHDGVQDVNNCNKCLCPLGWNGDKCDQRPTHTKVPTKCQLETLRIVMPAGNKTTEYRVEYYLLTAPPGMKVQMTPKVLAGQWTDSCDITGMEVKFLRDQRYAGLQVCDHRVLQPTITSETNEMLVQAYTRGPQFAVDLEYRAVSTENDETSVACANGGVQDVNNSCKCICPVGWVGDKCDQRPKPKVIAVETYPKTKRIYMSKSTEYKVEYYLLKAPTGMKVQMTPYVMNAQRSKACDLMGIEVKFQINPRPKEYRVCYPHMQLPAIISETNEMLVRAYTLGEKFSVKLQFQANPAFKHLHPAECPDINKDNTVCGSVSCDSALVNSNDNSASCSNGKTLYADLDSEHFDVIQRLSLSLDQRVCNLLVQAYSLKDIIGVMMEFKAIKSAPTCETSIDCAHGGIQDVNNCDKCICSIMWIGDKCEKQNFDMYAYKHPKKCETSIACVNGGVQDVNNCDKCLCTVGWVGDKCDRRVIAVENHPKTQRIYLHKATKDTVKYYLLKAPEGMKVQVTTTIRNTRRSKKCDLMGIAFKFPNNPRPDGIRMCYSGVQPTLTLESNEMLVQAYTQGDEFTVELKYIAVN